MIYSVPLQEHLGKTCTLILQPYSKSFPWDEMSESGLMSLIISAEILSKVAGRHVDFRKDVSGSDIMAQHASHLPVTQHPI